MLVALNVGNTDLKLGLARGGTLVATRRTASQREIGPDELELQLEGLLELEGTSLGEAESLVLASVVPAYDAALAVIAERRDLPLLVAGPDSVPLPTSVERPSEIGADRLVNAYAAARLHGTPTIVVDLGTATTVTAVSADGTFMGGAIAAGVRLGLEALAMRTAKLPRVELRAPERAIGRDTAEALRSGAVFGHLGALREIVQRVSAELVGETKEPNASLGAGRSGTGADRSSESDRRPRLVLTGGLSSEPWLAELGADAVDPHLTLRGLLILHAEVTGSVVGERTA
jgi:type III pantothenate kinase